MLTLEVGERARLARDQIVELAADVPLWRNRRPQLEDLHEAGGIAYRQRAEQQHVDEAEDGRARGQRHGDERGRHNEESGRAPQPPQRVAKIR
jgi:hypothetical protein